MISLSRKRIAVIGAGCFGTIIAIDLAKLGFSVTLFERNEQILTGATFGSVRRVHLGAHYPRHLPTARQSREGFSDFCERFPESIYQEFPNFYAISKDFSRTTDFEFKEFLSLAEIPYSPVDLNELEEFGVNIDLLSSAWRCPEAVIDFNTFKTRITADLEFYNVQLNTHSEICSIVGKAPELSIETSCKTYGKFDFIVRSTYNLDVIELNGQKLNSELSEFQRTIILKTNSSRKRLGLTVIDGDFLTYLPCGFEKDSYLVYAPKPSVLIRESSVDIDKNISSRYGNIEIEIATNGIKSRLANWFTDGHHETVLEGIQSFRVIKPNVTDTDERESSVFENDVGIYTVFSGKLDHCISVSEEIQKRIKQSGLL